MITESEKKWLILNAKIQKSKVIRSFKVLREKEIEPILIKGLAIERFYPDNKPRISFDIDLAVSAADYLKTKCILKKSELKHINIDLHQELRHFDKTDWKSLFQRSKLIEIQDYEIRVLSEEDHLRVLCIHWLTDGGENKDKLWDIFYAVTNRSKDFNWDICFANVDKKRRLWIKYTIGLAHKYLGLKISDIPYNFVAEELPVWLTKSLESIWNREFPFIPLDACYSDKKMFFYQLKLRFPPNPIMATIGVEGDMAAKTRVFYQVKYIVKRSIPTIRSYLRYKFSK